MLVSSVLPLHLAEIATKTKAKNSRGPARRPPDKRLRFDSLPEEIREEILSRTGTDSTEGANGVSRKWNQLWWRAQKRISVDFATFCSVSQRQTLHCRELTIRPRQLSLTSPYSCFPGSMHPRSTPFIRKATISGAYCNAPELINLISALPSLRELVVPVELFSQLPALPHLESLTLGYGTTSFSNSDISLDQLYYMPQLRVVRSFTIRDNYGPKLALERLCHLMEVEVDLVDFSDTPVASAVRNGELRALVEYLCMMLPNLKRIHFGSGRVNLSKDSLLDALFRSSMHAQRVLFASELPYPGTGSLTSALNCAIFLCEPEDLFRLIHYPGFTIDSFFVDKRQNCVDCAQLVPYSVDVTNILYSRYIVMTQANPTYRSEEQLGAMVLRALSKCPLAAVKLIELGFSPHSVLPNGTPLLFQAIKDAPIEVIQQLVARNADPYGLHNDVPLASYAMGRALVLQYVCSITGTDMTRPEVGNYVFRKAIECWDNPAMPIPRCIIEYAKMFDLNPNLTDDNGTRLLGLALRHWKDLPFALALLEMGADSSLIDSDGSNALHGLCQFEVCDRSASEDYRRIILAIIGTCLDSGLTWLSPDVYGRTPIDTAIASQEHCEEFFLMLIQYQLFYKREDGLFLVYRMCQVLDAGWEPTLFREMLRIGLITQEDALSGRGKIGEVIAHALGKDSEFALQRSDGEMSFDTSDETPTGLLSHA